MCVLTNKRKYIEQNFHSIAGVMPHGRDLGVLGVKNFSVGICDGAQSTAHSSFFKLHTLDIMIDAWGPILLYIQLENALHTSI